MGKRHWLRHIPEQKGVFRVALVLGLVLAIPVVSACATPVPDAQATDDGAASPASTSASSTPRPSNSSQGEDPGDVIHPQPQGIPKTLRGTVSAGVEANCVVMSADDGQTYLLIGGDRQLIMGGGRLEVTGQILPDLMTTCQQGTPFTVVTVRKL